MDWTMDWTGLIINPRPRPVMQKVMINILYAFEVCSAAGMNGSTVLTIGMWKLKYCCGHIMNVNSAY